VLKLDQCIGRRPVLGARDAASASEHGRKPYLRPHADH
jgi:hypothetical protein